MRLLKLWRCLLDDTGITAIATFISKINQLQIMGDEVSMEGWKELKRKVDARLTSVSDANIPGVARAASCESRIQKNTKFPQYRTNFNLLTHAIKDYESPSEL